MNTQRQIKFRAWDNESKRFLDNNELFMHLRDGWVFNSKLDDGYKDLQLQQFTGYQIDGRDIYEGDAVNYVTGNPKTLVNCKVCFGEYDTYTKLVEKNPGEYEPQGGEPEHHTGFYIESAKGEKIPLRSLWLQYIGNIYENTDLL